MPDWLFKIIQMAIILAVGFLLIYLGVRGIAVGFIAVVAASLVTLAYVRFMERLIDRRYSNRILPPASDGRWP